MILKSKMIKSVYGKVRIIENYNGYKRLYVIRTNIKTYILSENIRYNLDDMVEVNNNYHFSTLKELHNEINK